MDVPDIRPLIAEIGKLRRIKGVTVRKTARSFFVGRI